MMTETNATSKRSIPISCAVLLMRSPYRVSAYTSRSSGERRCYERMTLRSTS
jgi:hypothetical protein